MTLAGRGAVVTGGGRGIGGKGAHREEEDAEQNDCGYDYPANYDP